MLTKKYFALFFLVLAGGLSAQAVKPFTDEEFRYYEYQLRTGQTERYRSPSMKKDAWRIFMNDVVSQIVDVKVPANIQEWRSSEKIRIPSRNVIRLLAARLRQLLANPELEEVSGIKLQWFKNIGNGFIVLENYQKNMIRAVESGRDEEYLKLYDNYMQNVRKLKKLLGEYDAWKLSRKELNEIQKKNTAIRKRQADELARRYELTRKKKAAERQNQRRDNSNKKMQQKNNTKRGGAKR